MSTFKHTLFFFLLVTQICFAQGTWTKIGDMPEIRCAHTADEINGKVYIAGGVNTEQGAYPTTMLIYDKAESIWTTIPLPGNSFRGQHTSCVVDSNLYLIGGVILVGGTVNSTTEMYMFKPSTSEWILKNPMLTDRNTPACALLDGKIYVAGGLHVINGVPDYNGLKTFEVYDLASETWSALPDMPTYRWGRSVVAFEGKIYVFGGRGISNRPVAVDVYDPQDSSWTTVTNIPTPRYQLAACVLDSNIYAIDGWYSSSSGPIYDKVEVYNPLTNQWNIETPMPVAVAMLDGYALDGKIYMYGGSYTTHPNIGISDIWEFTPQDTIHIPADYPTIQQGIEAANNGDLVLVDEGTYLENINFKGKAITVASHYLIDGDKTHIENTAIDGSQPTYPDSASVVTFRSGEDTNSVICGFTIRGGTGTIIPHAALLVRMGGGVLVYSSDASVKNNIIESNNIQHSTDSYGGGICAISENGNNYIIENNIIRENSINTPSIVYYSLGGGIYTGTTGYVRILNNKILNNTITAPTAYGGGVVPAGANNNNYFILNNIISGNILNAATGASGGIDIYNHSPVVKNNLIILNSAPTGGGLLIENASPLFSNNTIANNTATVSGGGINIISANPSMINCIIWGNAAPAGSQINGSADVSYSDIEGGFTGTGNINQNPEFIAGSEFYLLAETSPCKDAGNPGAQYNDVEDPQNLGYALWPALGTLSNDIGHFGGPVSLWGYRGWPLPVEEDQIDGVPTEYNLAQNYPNPFNPSTTIRYSIPQTSRVVIKVYDILGNEIALLIDEEKTVGTYELTWNAASMPSGVYFYQLRVGDYVNTKKMVLMK